MTLLKVEPNTLSSFSLVFLLIDTIIIIKMILTIDPNCY